ncbi:MAG: hypothetical protein GEV04_24435 [Actinophytocola sp.]|nr:hypothetical protein [Actinophytocola sp.]
MERDNGPDDPAEETPAKETPAESVDDAWQRLVADFHRDDDGDPSWPQAENVDTENAEADGDSTDEATDSPSGRKRAKVSIVSLDDDEQPADLDDDHFVPPEPPPLPKGDLWTKLAWLVMLAAIAYPTAGFILDWRMPGWAIVLAVAGFVGGIVTHVVRMRDPQQDGTGPDDGAVV